MVVARIREEAHSPQPETIKSMIEGHPRTPARAPRGPTGSLLRTHFVSAIAVTLLPQCLLAGGVPREADRATALDGNLVSRFRREYPECARNLEAAVSNAHAVFETIETRSDKPEPSRASGDIYVLGEMQQTVRKVADPATARTSVMSITPDCVFELLRTSDDAAYVISEFNDTRSADVRRRFEIASKNDVDAYLGGASHVSAAAVLTLLEKATALNARELSHEGRTYLEVSFEFAPPFRWKTATVRFDPSTGYAVSEYEFQIAGKDGATAVVQSATVHCERREDGRIVPLAVHERLKNVAHHLEVEKDVRIKYVSFGDVSPSQFTLAAFGLPDISVREKRADYPFALWCFVALAGIAVAGFFYRIVSGRRSNPVSASENRNGPT